MSSDDLVIGTLPDWWWREKQSEDVFCFSLKAANMHLV